MVLGTIAEARTLAGNPSTSNVSDATITLGLEYGTSRAISITGKTDWETDTTHANYKSVVTAVESFASSFIRDRFENQTNISTEHYDRAKDILAMVADALSSEEGGGPGSATAAYRSYPLNPNAPIYKSLLPTGTLIGVYMYDNGIP